MSWRQTDGTWQESFILLACVRLDGLLAQLALDAAAPVELAPAALGRSPSRRREAAPAAHQIAAVGAGRVAVAAAAARARRPGVGVGVAEVARAVDEDEIVAGRPVERPVALDQPRALTIERDFGRGVVTVQEPVAGLTERRQLVPARPYTARPGNTVALAADLRVPVHRLPTNTLSFN